MWNWAIWGALIVGAAAVAAALALLVVRILAAWRAFKATRRRLFRGLEDIAAKGEATTESLAAAGETAELHAGLLRLRRSLAQLAVLREALDEVQDTFGRLTAVMPRK
jgi:hypothetical protein